MAPPGPVAPAPVRRAARGTGRTSHPGCSAARGVHTAGPPRASVFPIEGGNTDGGGRHLLEPSVPAKKKKIHASPLPAPVPSLRSAAAAASADGRARSAPPPLLCPFQRRRPRERLFFDGKSDTPEPIGWLLFLCCFLFLDWIHDFTFRLHSLLF